MSCSCNVLTQAKHVNIYIYIYLYNHLFLGFQTVNWQLWYCLGTDNLRLGRYLSFWAVILWQQAGPHGSPFTSTHSLHSLHLTSTAASPYRHRNVADRMVVIHCLIVGASFLISIKFWNKVTFLVLSHYVLASFVRLWNSVHHTKYISNRSYYFSLPPLFSVPCSLYSICRKLGYHNMHNILLQISDNKSDGQK